MNSLEGPTGIAIVIPKSFSHFILLNNQKTSSNTSAEINGFNITL